MNTLKEHWIGMFGLIALCAGIPLEAGAMQNACNIAGVFGLIAYAKVKNNAFFFYLELVVMLSTLLKIFAVSPIILITALIIATSLALLKIFQDPAYRVWDTAFGLIGLSGLVYGYAALSNYGYAVGGVASAIYSIIGFRKGVKSGFIFAILNLIYGGIAIFMIVKG